MANPIALAVPVFFVSIGIELAWAKKRGVSVYRVTDAITDLSCGITSQIILLVWATTQLGIYAWVLEHAALVRSWPAPWVPWIVAFFGVDFLYYWWHRLSHEVNILWAAHVVHHQSEDYNLAVALRQAVLTSWTVLPFYLPLAVLGVPTIAYATTVAVSTLYQFWIHTRLVGRIGGPIERILNLPHHHRVHHAINPQYLDKNYGAILIVWDVLFGTYADEVEEPVYGITKPLASFDPMWAQVHYWLDIAKMSAAAKGADKLRAFVASPAWKPAGYDVPVPPVTGRAKYERSLTRGQTAWVVALYGLVVVATFAIMMWHASMPKAIVLLGGGAVLLALAGIGALFEARRWATPAHVAALALGAAAIVLGVSCKAKKPVHVADAGDGILPREAASGGGEVAVSARTASGRSYVLVAPKVLEPGKTYPLVLALHGDGGGAASFHQAWPFEKASKDGAVIAYPDGRNATWDLEGGRDGRENPDLVYLEAIIDDVARALPVDRTRVFGAGYSSGGFLLNLLACRKSGVLRAFASNAGGAPYNQAETWPNGFTRCPGQAPVAMMALHGTSDYGVTLGSGRFSAAYWAYVNGCDEAEMETTGYQECTAYRGCKKPVVWCEVPGLGHWVWTEGAQAAWTFFQRQ